MNRDTYALHRTPTLDPQYAYCMEARKTLARIEAAKAARRTSVVRRILSLFGF